MALREKTLDYRHGNSVFEAFVAWDDSVADPQPGVLIAHAWGVRSAFEEDKARALAQQGYVAFALDMYGKGIRGSSPEENAALMNVLLDDRAELQARIATALAVLREQPGVDSARCGAMGYCFGGLCVLDLARSGSDVKGVISLHGLFNAAGNTEGIPITAKVLCLHGYDDPMAPPESVLALAAELSAAGADWQLHAYGATMHAFTNPMADNPAMGTVYSPVADARAAASVDAFFSEIFAV